MVQMLCLCHLCADFAMLLYMSTSVICYAKHLHGHLTSLSFVKVLQVIVSHLQLGTFNRFAMCGADAMPLTCVCWFCCAPVDVDQCVMLC